MKKIIFCDYDGTLTGFLGSIMSSKTIKMINDYIDKGGYFILNTGRDYAMSIDVLKQIGLLGKRGYSIMAIGNQIFDNEKEEFIYNTYMSNSTTLNILTDIRNKYKSFFLTTLDKELFLDNYLPNNKNTDMMLKAFNVKKIDLIDYIIKTKKYPCKFFFFDEYNKLKIIYDDLKNKYSELDFYFDSKLIDIVPNKMNKGLGIDYILDLLKIEKSESIAIGDSINDISMFNHVGVKVAVSNACLELKDAADLIIDNSRNEAVADLIERVLSDKI